MTRSFEFEVLAADRAGKTSISSVQAFMHGLLFDERLWQLPELVEKNGNYLIKDSRAGMVLTAHLVENTKPLSEQPETLFIVRIGTRQADLLDEFRSKILNHLQNRLGFSDLRIAKDDVTGVLAEKCFYHIYTAEARVRGFVTRFFSQKLGLQWLEGYFSNAGNTVSVPEGVYSQHTLNVGLEQLAELMASPASLLQKNDYLLQRILHADESSDLLLLQKELSGGYAALFSEYFQGTGFVNHLRLLATLQKQILVGSFLTQADLDRAEKLQESISELMGAAEEKMQAFNFSATELKMIADSGIRETQVAMSDARRLKSGNIEVKVLGKIDLPEQKKKWLRPEEGPMPEYQEPVDERVISEPELLDNLEKAEVWHHERGMDYVGLKGFVTKWLANNHFAIPPAYSLVNDLKERGVIDVYDVEVEGYGFPVKAIRKTNGEPIGE